MSDDENDDDNVVLGKKINGITITHFISSGGFGKVYSGVKRNTKYAIKIPIITDEKNGQKLLENEYKIYKTMNKNKDNPNFFNICYFYCDFLDCKVLIMDLLGETLNEYLEKNTLTPEFVSKIGIQIITIVRFIHKCGFIHRDLKPENFVFDLNDKNKIYCIDFGLTKSWIKNDEHIPFKKIGKFCGTAKFASLNAQKCNEQSRRDDLESIGYILVYMLKKSLPWQNLKIKDKKKKYKKIFEKKENFDTSDLPKELVIYLNYVKNLKFDDKPLYGSLKKLIENLTIKRTF